VRLAKLAAARKQAVQAIKLAADRHAANVLPVIQEVPGLARPRFATLLRLSTLAVSQPLAGANGTRLQFGTCLLVHEQCALFAPGDAW
jgi:hypothetical protein